MAFRRRFRSSRFSRRRRRGFRGSRRRRAGGRRLRIGFRM